MTLYEQSIMEGWLHKDHRFTIRIFLKRRYFVLQGTKLLYFKQPYDKCPVGTIQFKYFHLVKIQRTGPLYGFRITSQCTNHRSPVLYADSQEERYMWMTKIQSALDALSGYNRLCDENITIDRLNKNQNRKSYQPVIYRKKNTPRSFFSLSIHDSMIADISTQKSGHFSSCKSLPECSNSPVDESSISKSLYPLISEDSIYEIEKTFSYLKSSIHIESERDIYISHITDPEVTLHIEKITNPTSRELNWATIFLLCNSVNSTKTGARDARKILQKKMMATNPQTQVFALETLNCLAENCSVKFKEQILTKSFGEDLFTLASSQTLDDKVHGKVVQSLKNWIDQFGSDPASGAVRKAYDVMVNKLVLPDIGRTNQSHKPFLRTPTTRQPRKPSNIHDDVAIAKNCAEILDQMLKHIDPLSEDIKRNKLIQEFYENGKQKQQSLVTYLASCEDPDVICTLLEANSRLLSCFEIYDDIIEQRLMVLAATNYENLNDCSTVDVNQQQHPKSESINSTS